MPACFTSPRRRTSAIGRPFAGLSASLAALGALTVVAEAQTPKSDTNWASFRGNRAQGVAEGYKTPHQWNAEENKNVLWKTPIPGLGHSSPIIWGDKLFITTAMSGSGKDELKVGLYGDIDPVEDESAHQWKVYCLNKRTGKVIWEKVAHKGVPKIKRHTKATHANCTMATDGKNVLAFFGSEGLFCYDMNGKLRWKKDFGVLDSGYYMVQTAQWGFASSPIIYKDRVIVQCDVQNGSFVGAYRLKDGEKIWLTPRDDVPTWSAPAICESGGRTQVVVNGWKHIGGYDMETGKSLWKMKGGGDIPVPTPIIGHDLIFIANAHGPAAPLYAIRPNAEGDISLKDEEKSNAYIAWSERRNGAYMQTPIIYGDLIYSCRDYGILSCYEAKTGKRLYQERLKIGQSGFTASPVAADGKLYFTGEEGEVYVVEAGPSFKLLATNPMGEVCMATPAISEGVLFFRTRGHVVAIGEKR